MLLHLIQALLVMLLKVVAWQALSATHVFVNSSKYGNNSLRATQVVHLLV